jgi:hypothetical protein
MILKLLSKGEKRDKMKRTIQALAMLIAITLLAVWMVGCGGEELTTATVTGVVPAEGETVAANTEITITFDNPVTDVTVNGQPATGSGKTWKYKGTESAPLAASNTIAWTNEDESAGEGKTVAYTVEAADEIPPEVTGSTPKDGDKNKDPEEINEDGMEITFSEALKKASIEVTIEGEPLPWSVELSDDKKTAKLLLIKGGDLPYEAEVVITVNAEDLAGNKLEGHEITFTTAAKEE